MRCFKLHWLFLLMIHLLACGEEGRKRESDEDSIPIPDSRTNDTDVTIPEVQVGVKQSVIDEKVPVIDSQFFHPKGKITGTFDVKKALTLLFPGNLYTLKEGIDSVVMITWRCPDCRSLSVASGTEDESPLNFPGNESWDTRVLKPLYIRIGGRDAVILPFYSSVFNESVTHTGRFNAPVFGTAVFINRNRKWELVDFKPALVKTGTFGHSPQPVKVPGAETVIFSQKVSNGPAGGPFIEKMIVYGWYKDQVRLLAEISPSARIYSGLSDWDTELLLKKEKYNGLPLLQVTTKGSYYGDQLEDWEKDLLPELVKEKARTESKFDFTLITLYRVEQNKYVSFDSDIEVKPYSSGGIQ